MDHVDGEVGSRLYNCNDRDLTSVLIRAVVHMIQFYCLATIVGYLASYCVVQWAIFEEF